MTLLRIWLVILACVSPGLVHAAQPPTERVDAFYRVVMHPTAQESAAPGFAALRPFLGEDLARALAAYEAYEHACGWITPPDLKPYMIDQNPFFLTADIPKKLESVSQRVRGDLAHVSATFNADDVRWTDTVLLRKEHGRWVILDLQWKDDWSLTKRLVEFASHRCAQDL